MHSKLKYPHTVQVKGVLGIVAIVLNVVLAGVATSGVSRNTCNWSKLTPCARGALVMMTRPQFTLLDDSLNGTGTLMVGVNCEGIQWDPSASFRRWPCPAKP